MNEGVGSTTILVIMMVFVTVVSAYMAYNVNYTKAFRLKNKIIATYDKYEGECGTSSACWSEIEEYAKDIGYTKHANLRCSDSSVLPANVDTTQERNYFCEYKIKVNNSSSGAGVQDEGKDYYYYRILTRIDIQIPIVQNVLSLRALTVTGDTKVYAVDK